MLLSRLVRVGRLGVGVYVEAGVSQFAAAISYRVLFSLVPFVALTVALLDLFLPEDVEASIVAWIGERLSPTGEGGAEIAQDLVHSTPPATLAGLISLLVLLWSAAGMMAALRAAFAAILGGGAQRPYLRAKGLDVALVLLSGVLVLAAFALTILSRVVGHLVATLGDWLGRDGSAGGTATTIAELTGSGALTFVALGFLYSVVPAKRPPLRAVMVGSAVAAVGTVLASSGFGLYLEHFASFDDLYGPLGTVLAFLLLVYILAMIVLVGACVVASWEASAAPAPPSGPRQPLRVQLGRLARSLVSVRSDPPTAAGRSRQPDQDDRTAA